jgi:hypothetical protein
MPVPFEPQKIVNRRRINKLQLKRDCELSGHVYKLEHTFATQPHQGSRLTTLGNQVLERRRMAYTLPVLRSSDTRNLTVSDVT